MTADLVRGIRRWDLVGLVINSVIGAGIFGLPSAIFRLTGSYSLLAYLVCACFVVLIVLCFAEVGSRFSATGGPYLYALRSLGPLIGFEVGWLLWLARLTAFAALGNLFVDYLAYFAPAAGAGVGRAAAVTILIVSLAAVNLIGVRRAAIVSDAFVVAKLTPLALFILVGAMFVEPSRYVTPAPPEPGAFAGAVLLLVFTFSGFETAVIAAGETATPQRHMPFALLTGIGVIVTIYVAVQAVCIGTLPGLADSERPLADAASVFLGSLGGGLISLGALVSITGTLNSIMLAAPRLLFAMAEQGQLPAAMRRTHPRFHTPHVAILSSAALMLGLTLGATFLGAVAISTIIRLFAYASTCVAVPILRRQGDAPPAGFLVPGGALVASLAILLIGWLLVSTAGAEVGITAVAAGVGLMLYLPFRRAVRPGFRNAKEGPAG